jgi:hypothetical protein
MILMTGFEPVPFGSQPKNASITTHQMGKVEIVCLEIC